MRGSGAGRERHVHLVRRWKDAEVDETLQGLRGCNSQRTLVVRNGEVEVTPVDAEIVAGAAEDALIARAHAEDGESAGLGAAPGDGLVLRVD